MEKVMFEIMKNSGEFENQISIGFNRIYDVCIAVCLNGRNLLDILKDRDLFEKAKEKELSDKKTLDMDFSYDEYAYDYVLENFDNLLDCIDLFLFYDDIDVKEILKKNPILKNKKIVLNKFFNISDFEKLQELKKDLDGINVYVRLDGNTDYVSLKSCENTMDYIKNIGDKVKSLNLSPFETIIFVYDIVRDRYYKYEDKGEKYTKSRDLSEVAFGEAIVCHGYAELFKAILNYIGIETRLATLSVKNEIIGHTRNEIYVVDPKYDINGVYYFDTTWDSKERGKEDQFLLKYKYLAKTREEMEEIENHIYEYDNSPKYSQDMLEKFKNALENRDIKNVFDYIMTFRRLGRVAGSKLDLDPTDYFTSGGIKFENIKYELEEILKKYNKSISAETYIRAINEVRKIEYYMDSEKYPYSLEVLYCIFMNSEWKFKNSHNSSEERLLSLLFGIDTVKEHTRRQDYLNYMRNDFDKVRDIPGVHLTKILRKELERKEKTIMTK